MGCGASVPGICKRMRLAINRHLMLGLFEFEAQFLRYPPGGFYLRHVDARGGAVVLMLRSSRTLTLA